ncbi:uncharacterized protein [Choristoneura fumiferana]|uniref:uncharacterized protein n=1 Tax=Choristoneura fumiferana TaxID=7141 RepID=UPI003D15E73F
MKPKNNSLNRAESADVDKLEPSGPELVKFIKETLNKNARDRMTLLKIEKELHALVTDTGRCIVKFPVMTSYGRMLVHRAAALFQLTHHLDQATKNSVTVSKSGTCGGRIPCTSFKQWCTVNFPPSPVRHQDSVTQRYNRCFRSILKRDTHSPDDSGSNCRAVERSKSLEQREKDYERVRRRIFSEQDSCCQDESQWPWLNAGPVKLLTPDTGRNKLLKVQSLESSGPCQQSWRSRGAVSKSHSFGGYGTGADPPPQRLLSRQGDLASSSWRLSPSSSGYKTLSLRSTDSITPSPTGGASPEPAPEGAVVWAVTDLSSVPPGALVIHPQTGRPLTNADGSVYHFDPANPPVIYDASAYLQDQKIQNCEKRRGRLEKQHSFIDGEAECRCDDGRDKCCCDCRRHDSCAQGTNEKVASQTEQKSIPVPPSPVKNRYEQSTEQPTNEQPPTEPPANQRPPYDAPANQVAVVEPTTQRTDITTNQMQAFEPATNPTAAFESKFEPAVNQRQYSPSQRFENRTFVASPHQRPPSFDSANHRAINESTNQMPPINKLANQESVEVQQYVQHGYSKGYRNDEVTSPPQPVHNQVLQPDVSMYNIMAQAKITPIPVQDPNLRPMSLTNMIFPGPIAQAYPYVNQVRLEQPLQPLYQPVMPEEHKLAPSPHTNDTTFRIDPSYPYPLQYGAACGACAGLDQQPRHRGYNLGYGQLEQPVLQQPYPVGNVLLQHNVQHYPYQEAMPWGGPALGAPGKLLVHELCPGYPQYPYLYPQMIPQPYPIMQPVYPAVDKRPKRGSVPNSHRATPLEAPERRDGEIAAKIQQMIPQPLPRGGQEAPERRDGEIAAKIQQVSPSAAVSPLMIPQPLPRGGQEAPERRDGEIAAKIQQIKDQMSQLNTQDKDRTGNGLLGSAPVGAYNGRMGRPLNDETQLTSAARAIVNSIRSMQANTYQHETRRQYSDAGGYRERERRRDERDDKRRPPLPRQVTDLAPGNWCRRSPGPIHPALNHPRRPHPDTRNARR